MATTTTTADFELYGGRGTREKRGEINLTSPVGEASTLFDFVTGNERQLECSLQIEVIC